MAAVLTDEGPALGEAMELRIDATAGTNNFRAAIVRLHELGEAGHVIRVDRLKLFESVGSGVQRLSSLPAIRDPAVYDLLLRDALRLVTQRPVPR